MGSFSKAAAIIVILAMLAVWTVWASDQVNPGEIIEISGTVLKSGRLQGEQGR